MSRKCLSISHSSIGGLNLHLIRSKLVAKLFDRDLLSSVMRTLDHDNVNFPQNAAIRRVKTVSKH